MGQPKESAAAMYERSKQESPAMAQFVEEATKDLMFGADAHKHTGKDVDAVVRGVDVKAIHQNAADLREAFSESAEHMGEAEESDDDMRNAFAASVMSPKKKVSSVTTEQFKETASAEADDTLQKLLKGLR